MARSIELLVRIAVDAARAGQDIDSAAGRAASFGDNMGNLAIPAAAAGAAVVAFGKNAIDAASAAQQAVGGVEAVFGASAQQVVAWGEDAVNSAGLSTTAYETMAAGIGGALTGMGVPMDAAAQSTQDLITRSADLASVFGGTTAEAADAVTSAFRGEYDSLQRLIPGMSGAAVEAQMAADAQAGLTFASQDAAKAHAITAVIMDKSAAAAGNFAKESDTAEGASARAGATAENTAATLGESLLPAYTALQGVLQSVAEWVGQNSTLVMVLAGVIGGLAAAVLLVNGVMAVASAATAVWAAIQGVASGVATGFTAVMGALNAVFAANPVVIVVIAVIALIAAIVLLWNNCEAFRSFVIGMWEAISTAATAAWSAITSAASAAWNAIKAVASSVWNAISSVVSSVTSGISSAVSGIVGGIVGAWNSIRAAAETAWQAISSVVSTVTSTISSVVSGIQSGIEAVWRGIQRAGEAVWAPIQAAAEAAMGVIMGVIDGVMGAIEGIGSAIQGAIGWATDLWGKITGASDAAAAVPAVASSAGFAAVASPSLTRAGLLAAPTPHAAPASTGPTIIVNGALDPDAVARQIEQLLRGRGRRSGGLVV